MAANLTQKRGVKTVPAIGETVATPTGLIPAWPGKVTPPRTITQVKRLLARLIAGFIRHEIDGGDAKTVAYLCSIFAQIIKDSDFEARLSALEKQQDGGKYESFRAA